MPIRKSSVGGVTPSGTTADRPANPSIGDTFFNGTLGVQEIYTTSGWLPATGANDFNVVLSGEDTSVTLDKEYFSGAYTITSALSDTSFDIYLFDTQGNSAGYTKSPSVNATSNFNKIVVLGGQAGDLLSFSYKTTFSTASITDEVTVGPIIKSISVSDLPNIDDTTVITGINFAEDIQVTFTGTNDVALSAKSVVRSSTTSLLVTRPDNLLEDYSPYTVTVTNPGTISPTGSNGHISTNAITAGGDPAWTTSAGQLTSGAVGSAYSTTVQATDPDGGTITYSIASGSLPSGLSLNGTTGEISGTPSSAGTSFVVAATDPSGNVTNRSFSIALTIADGGTPSQSDGYTYHTFTSNGTFNLYADATADILVVAGGGAGGVGYGSSGVSGGGGGAGGYQSFESQSLTAASYSVTIGAGGTALATSAAVTGPSGTPSQFGALAESVGGGGGGSRTSSGATAPGSGGSGGGAAFSFVGGSPVNGQGNKGGDGSTEVGYSGGGGGAAAEGTAFNQGGNGGDGSQWLNGNYYAGGGGRGKPSGGNPGTGGVGGGASGVDGTVPQAGAVNSGGGGAGGRSAGAGGGFSSAGGSGIVIIRYAI